MSFVYALLRFLNDLNAVSRGKVVQRVGRVGYGKAAGRLASRIFR